MLKTNFHRRAHCWGQGGLGSGPRIGGASGELPCVRPPWVAPSRRFRLVLSPACPPDPQLPPDGAAHRLLLVQLGSADACGRVLHGLPAPAAVAAHLRAHPVRTDAPTSFLMGCHLDHFEEVSKVSTCCWIQSAESHDFERMRGELLGGEGGHRGLGQLQHRAPACPLCPRGVLRARALSVTPDTVSQVCREVRAGVRVEVTSAAY